MKNQSWSPVQFFASLVLFFYGLLNFRNAFSNAGTENNVVAYNWGTPLVVLPAIVFGLGWWFEGFVEQLVLSKGRKTAIVVLCCFFLLFASLVLGTDLIFTRLEFLQSVMGTNGYFLMCGFVLRFSVAKPEVIAELRERN